jgi:4-aminobutyrate aminotransferase-like enzyme
MLGAELVKNRKTKEPAADAARQVVQLSMKQGVLVSTSGTYGNVVRLIPPLNIDEEAARTAVKAIDDSLKQIEASK